MHYRLTPTMSSLIYSRHTEPNFPYLFFLIFKSSRDRKVTGEKASAGFNPEGSQRLQRSCSISFGNIFNLFLKVVVIIVILLNKDNKSE